VVKTVIYKSLYILVVTMLLFLPFTASAENIDPDNDGSQYAWGENVGWINFEPSQSSGVTVTNTGLSGYAWGENIGWINLSPANAGVVNNGEGNLSGYAWGENVGWINFNPTGAGVKINPATGVFSGKAWGENIGWVNFAPNGKPVKTSWRPPLPDVKCNLVPDATSVHRGGALGIQISVTNNTVLSQTFLFVTFVTTPGGNRYPASGWLFGPVSVTLGGNASRSGHKSHNIPSGASLGNYTYHGYVGNYGAGLYDECQFVFEVIP